MKHFAEFVVSYISQRGWTLMWYFINASILWFQSLTKKTQQNSTIVLSWLCHKQLLYCKQVEIFNSFLWQLSNSHTVEYLDIVHIVNKHSLIFGRILITGKYFLNDFITATIIIWCESLFQSMGHICRRGWGLIGVGEHSACVLLWLCCFHWQLINDIVDLSSEYRLIITMRVIC